MPTTNTVSPIKSETAGACYLSGATVFNGYYALEAFYSSTIYSSACTFRNMSYYINITTGSYWHSANDTIDISYSIVAIITYGSKADIVSINTPGTGKTINASNDSTGLETGTHLNGATFSPVVGVVGNTNSVWR